MSKFTLKRQASLTQESNAIDSINKLKEELGWTSVGCFVHLSQSIWWKPRARLSPKARALAVGTHPSRNNNDHNNVKLHPVPCPADVHSPETTVSFCQELAKKPRLEGPWGNGEKKVWSVSWLSSGLPPLGSGHCAHTAREKTRTGAAKKGWILGWCFLKKNLNNVRK